MLSSVNPDAVERIEEDTRPLPGVGQMVRYYPRMGEVRNGKPTVPALVLGGDVVNRTLDLLVFFESDDFIGQQHVPRRRGEDRGWEPVDRAAKPFEELDAFKAEVGEAMFGEHFKPENSLLDLIESLRARVEVLESGSGSGAIYPNAEAAASSRRGRRAAK